MKELELLDIKNILEKIHSDMFHLSEHPVSPAFGELSQAYATVYCKQLEFNKFLIENDKE